MRIVVVAPYDQQWPVQYQAERARLEAVLKSVMVSSHHIGSTSVPGLVAKPVIDILLEVTDLSELDKCNWAMAASGFDARGENGIAGRRYFTKGGERRSHQVHAFEVGDEQIVKHLAFRDYLIENPQVAEAYAELKQNAAKVCRNDIKRYQQMKNDFISHYLKLAMEEPEARQKATKANGGSKAQIPRTDT
jgi:GrpB-like predicted nucleotidyltransferase (UPF0157 family)